MVRIDNYKKKLSISTTNSKKLRKKISKVKCKSLKGKNWKKKKKKKKKLWEDMGELCPVSIVLDPNLKALPLSFSYRPTTIECSYLISI